MPERFQRELEEILQDSGKFPDKKGSPSLKGASRRSPIPFTGFIKGVSPGKVLIASVALLLTALLIQGAAPTALGILLWVSLILFVTAYAMVFVRWENGSARRWRGKVVDYRVAHSGWQRFRRKLRF